MTECNHIYDEHDLCFECDAPKPEVKPKAEVLCDDCWIEHGDPVCRCKTKES